MTPKRNHHLSKKIIRELLSLRTIFDKKSSVKKLSLINKLSKQIITGSETLIEYHDIISFIRAYPDNAQIFRAVEHELKSFDKRIDQYKSLTRDKQAEDLFNSGIVNTTTEHSYSLGATEHLLSEHADAVSIDWETNDEVPEKISNIIQYLVAWQENDTLDNDDYLSIPDWLELARGNKTIGDLETFTKLVQRSNLPRDIQIHLFDNLDITTTWDLTDSKSSCTLKRLPCKNRFYQKEPIKKRTNNLRAELKKPTARLRHLSHKEGKEKVQAINEVLAVRNRELFPITYANPNEVYCFEPGRGMQIFLFGADHHIRLPLETNYGAMLVRNGLPIGYGIAATLFDRVEIAINVFPAFRAGESAFIIEQFFKLFHTHFGSNLFLVRSYQMGDGDDEPLKSGALWFYYKLGFRAVKDRIRKMVNKEYELIKKTKGYRSPIEKLRKLAKSDVFMHADENKMTGFEELSLINPGKIVTEYATKFDGNRNLMVQKSITKISKILPMKNRNHWSHNEIISLERMAPLIACIPNLSKWSNKEKTGLVDIIRAKGSTCERKYSVLASRHNKFKTAVEKMAASYKDR